MDTSDGKLVDDNIDNKQKVRREFDDSYPFPSDSYRNLFRFIERIYTENIGIQTFEYSTDIKDCLKQQWAGAMYTFLTKDKTVLKHEVQALADKIDGISATLRSLLDGKDSEGGKLSFNLASIKAAQDLSGIEEIKRQVFGYLEEVLMANGSFVIELQQNAKILLDDVEKWINTLIANIELYKWQPYISLTDLFSTIGDKIFIWTGRKYQVSTSLTIEFCMTMKTLKEKLEESEYNLLINAIHKRFQAIPVDDGIPF